MEKVGSREGEMSKLHQEGKEEEERRRVQMVCKWLFVLKQFYAILRLADNLPVLNCEGITLTMHDSSVDARIICADRREGRPAS